MSDMNPKPMSENCKRNRWRYWLIWGVVTTSVMVTCLPTILMPAANRIYFALKERHLNQEFRRNGINGGASFEGRLFDGTMYIDALNIDDSKLPALAKILKNERRIQIVDSAVTWQGLQHLVGCKDLKYVQFINAEVTEADLKKLQEAMPNSKVAAKWWRNERPTFMGKP